MEDNYFMRVQDSDITDIQESQCHAEKASQEISKWDISLVVKTENETIEFANYIAERAYPGMVLALVGEIGSGKTFFTKAFCKALGISYVTSPTFTIVNSYSIEPAKSPVLVKNEFVGMSLRSIFHFDYYRLNSINELHEIGFNDYLSSPESVVIIEWADLFRESLPKKYIEINLTVLDDFSRTISVKEHE